MAEFDVPADIGKDESAQVRRWLLELSLAESRDKEYRKCAQKIWEKYRGKNRKRNSFNILWANTEILSPAIFNSTPKPDVRRRFKDEDPVGKLGSEVIRRALEFSVDSEDFDGAIRFDVLDMLLPGRGVSRVRYVPSVSQTPREKPEGEQEGEQEDGSPEYDEALEWQQVCVDHVQWDRYRLGPGKTWSEIEWVGFEHRMTREELVEKFGELGQALPLDDCEDDSKNDNEKQDREVFRTAQIWEIWDKSEKKVRFLSKSNKDKFLKVAPDPLKLMGFFPIPKPIYAVLDSSCMEPTALYEQYREQAGELDRISTRINKIVDALRIRGIYDSTIKSLSQLMKGDDNDLIPVEEAARFTEQGFDKVIWFMPIEQAARVVQALYIQRDACKQVIYELTGISDILRGATDPNETLGAQEIKAQTGSQRVQQMQRDVARYIRDIMRMMGEIIGQQFELDTLRKMTGVQIPTDAEVQMQMLAYQQKAMMAQQSGQQPPPPPPQPVTWEKVIAVLRDDQARMFKIDIETDSTIAASIQQDMTGLRDVLTAVTQFIAGVAPAVQAGAFPVDAVKEIVMTIARRSKMGNAVEDALDKIQEPKPQPGMDPKEQLQQQAQAEQMKVQAKSQTDAARVQADTQIKAMQAQLDAQLEKQKHEDEMRFKAFQAQQDAKLEVMLAEIKRASAVDVARINAATSESVQ